MFAYNLKFSPHSSSEAEARFGCFELNITMIMITYIQAHNTLKLSRFTSFKCVDMLLRNIFQISDPLVNSLGFAVFRQSDLRHGNGFGDSQK